MRTVIVIDCCEDDEVISHIGVIRKQLKAAFKKRSIDEIDFFVKDYNCYGEHKATVEYDVPVMTNHPPLLAKYLP